MTYVMLIFYGLVFFLLQMAVNLTKPTNINSMNWTCSTSKIKRPHQKFYCITWVVIFWSFSSHFFKLRYLLLICYAMIKLYWVVLFAHYVLINYIFVSIEESSKKYWWQRWERCQRFNWELLVHYFSLWLLLSQLLSATKP